MTRQIDWSVVAQIAPVRRRILEWVADREPDDRFSASVIAVALGIDITIASYHLRALERHGHIRLVENVPVRGSVRHDYVRAGAWVTQ
jgi:DNA-binding transcriptional ArsR family regulator